MKFAFVAVVFNFFISFAHSTSLHQVFEREKLIERVQAVIDYLDPESIPAQFKRRGDNDNSQWCCRIDVPEQTIQKTRIASFQIQNSESRKCGYDSCGFLGLSKCTKWCHFTWMEIQYFQDSYSYTIKGECPANHVACCQNHVLVLGHCFHFDEISGNAELLAILNSQGILIPELSLGK